MQHLATVSYDYLGAEAAYSLQQQNWICGCCGRDGRYLPSRRVSLIFIARRWAGANAAPRTAPLDPAKAGNGAAPVAKTFTKVKTAAQLQKELDEALAKIARLEKKLADAGLSAE